MFTFGFVSSIGSSKPITSIATNVPTAEIIIVIIAFIKFAFPLPPIHIGKLIILGVIKANAFKAVKPAYKPPKQLPIITAYIGVFNLNETP